MGTKKDITTFELAQALNYIIGLVPINNLNYSETDPVLRHFKIM